MIDWKKRAAQLEVELDHTITAHNVLLDDNDQLRKENQTLRDEIKEARQLLMDALYRHARHNFEG
jgi:hypothetical protein